MFIVIIIFIDQFKNDKRVKLGWFAAYMCKPEWILNIELYAWQLVKR